MDNITHQIRGSLFVGTVPCNIVPVKECDLRPYTARDQATHRFFVSIKIDKASYRIPGVYDTVEAVQEAYAKETSTEKKTRVISKMIPPLKVEKKAKRGKKGTRKVRTASRRILTHEQVTVAQLRLELRIKQFEGKELKEVPFFSWTISPVAPVALAPKRQVKVKGKVYIPKPDKAYYAGLSSHPSNTGVIGASDMLLEFGPEAFSRTNRTSWYETDEPIELKNGETAIREVTHHVADWPHFHGFHENDLHAQAVDMVQIGKHEADVQEVLHGKPHEDDLIPLGRIPRGALRMLHQVQVNDPKAMREMLLKAGNKDPEPNEHLKYDGLIEILAKMSSLSGTQIDYSESEEGFSVDQESIDYSESYLANRRDNSTEQETHDSVNHVSSGNMFDKYSFFEACRAAYESPEYQLFLEFEKIGGGSVIDRSKEIMAVNAKLSETNLKFMEVETSAEWADLLEEKKKLKEELKELEDGNVNAEGLFNELLDTDSNKGVTLSYEDARKLYKKMKKEVFGKMWYAEKWLEILDGQEDKSREEAEQEIDSWGAAIFQEDTTEIYLSAEIGGSGVLYDMLDSDEKREEASSDAMMKEQKKEDFFAHVAVVYLQAMGFVQKVIIRDNYQAMLEHGVPARKSMVELTSEWLGLEVTEYAELMTEEIKPVEDFHQRQELLQDKWEELSSVPQKKSEDSSEE